MRRLSPTSQSPIAAPPPSTAPAASCWRWSHWLPLATAIGLGLAAILLRTCEVEAEADHYHERAEQLLAGVLAVDRFHPFGYPVLIAAVLALVGNSLLAGALVSAAAAGLLVWSTGAIAASLRPAAGGPARLLAAANAAVWVYGTMAASDMTAAALTTTAIAVLCTTRDQPTAWRSFAIGALLGSALAVRFSSAVLLVAVAAWTLARSPRGRTLLVLLAGIALGWAPQAILSTLATGSPFANDTWQILLLKVVCRDDLEQLQTLYDTGTMPTFGTFLREHWGDVLRHGFAGTGRAIANVQPAMLFGAGTPIPALTLWPMVVVLGGLSAVAGRRRTAAALAGIWLLTTVAVCTTFAPTPRALLGTLPFAVAGLAVALTTPLVRTALARPLIAAACLGIAGFGVARYRAFLAMQPTREVEIAHSLPRIVTRPHALMSTNPSMHRYAACRTWGYTAMPFATAAETWDAVGHRMEACGADLMLAGKRTNPAVYEHLATGTVPAGFRRLLGDDEVVLVERPPTPTDWIASFTVTPTEVAAGDALEFILTLSNAADQGAAAGLGALLLDPTGQQSLIELPRDGGRRYRQRMPASLPPGTWQIEPFVLRTDGKVLRGQSVAFAVVTR